MKENFWKQTVLSIYNNYKTVHHLKDIDIIYLNTMNMPTLFPHYVGALDGKQFYFQPPKSGNIFHE